MSTLNEHVKQYTSSDSRKNARDALLDAITQAVADVKKEGGGINFEVPRLKELATAYALVVHGPTSKE